MQGDELPSLTIGQRIQHHRERAGKTRAVLGGLVGRSAEWVKSVEKGRILPPRLSMLDKLASVLRVPLADLVGDEAQHIRRLATPGHAALPEVRAAVNEYTLVGSSPPVLLLDLDARVSAAWRARHRAADHRTVLGGILPGLIRDARAAALSYEGAERRRAQALMADVLGLTQMFVAFQPAAELVWRVSDRGMVAAQESGDPTAIAGAAWLLVEALRESGDWDSATRVALDTIQAVESHLSEGSNDLLAMWGSLHTVAALTAARAGEDGRAWAHWDHAERATQRLPFGYAHPRTWFSRPVLGFYAVSLCVELRRAREGLRYAERVDVNAIKSRPRRARHLVEVARAHQLRADLPAALATLRAAYDTAPETIRYNVHARELTMEALDVPALRADAQDLAVMVGLLS